MHVEKCFSEGGCARENGVTLFCVLLRFARVTVETRLTMAGGAFWIRAEKLQGLQRWESGGRKTACACCIAAVGDGAVYFLYVI